MVKQANGDAHEARLAESELRYQAVIENASDIIQSILPDGRFDFVNPTWHRILGYSESDLERLTIWDVIHPDSIDHCRPIFGRVMGGENVLAMEFDLIAKDGSRIPVQGNATPRIVEG